MIIATLDQMPVLFDVQPVCAQCCVLESVPNHAECVGVREELDISFRFGLKLGEFMLAEVRQSPLQVRLQALDELRDVIVKR